MWRECNIKARTGQSFLWGIHGVTPGCTHNKRPKKCVKNEKDRAWERSSKPAYDNVDIVTKVTKIVWNSRLNSDIRKVWNDAVQQSGKQFVLRAPLKKRDF